MEIQIENLEQGLVQSGVQVDPQVDDQVRLPGGTKPGKWGLWGSTSGSARPPSRQQSRLPVIISLPPEYQLFHRQEEDLAKEGFEFFDNISLQYTLDLYHPGLALKSACLHQGIF